MTITLKPIGYVHSTRDEIKDDYWGGVISTIHLDREQFDEDVTQGLEEFSHVEVVYYFHKVNSSKIETGARHPRNNTSWPKVGIFSQRAKGRPNQIALSCCKILLVEGLTITVQALDAIDGTPILDIKPYMKEFGPKGETHQPEWATELMEDYFKE